MISGGQPVTVYLRWPERDLLALSPLVRLVWGSLIDGLIATYDAAQGNSCRPVLLLIDEAGRTAIPALADHATTVAGRGISLWIAVQSLSQLDAVYGRVRAQVLRDNMESQIYYRPSNHETASYLERSLGRTSEYAHSQTQKEGTTVSQGLSEQARHCCKNRRDHRMWRNAWWPGALPVVVSRFFATEPFCARDR